MRCQENVRELVQRRPPLPEQRLRIETDRSADLRPKINFLFREFVFIEWLIRNTYDWSAFISGLKNATRVELLRNHIVLDRLPAPSTV
jgi:hypothetical protein